MSEFALLAQWALALVFTIAGVAKLRDLAGTAEAFAQFGVPQPLQKAAPLLPIVELMVAVSLIVPATARGGAVAAAGLLVVMSAAVAINLARGRRPDCNCFGRLSAGPIGAGTLVRNGILIGLAVLAAVPTAARPRELFDRFSGGNAWLAIAVAIMAVALIALGGLVVQLWLQQARLLLRIDALETARGSGNSQAGVVPTAMGPAIGTIAPDARDAEGAGRLSDHWSGGRSTLVVFGDPSCAACTRLYPKLVRWQETGDDRHVVVVTRPVDEAPRPDLAIFIEPDRSVSLAYEVRGTPSAVLVEKGKIASPWPKVPTRSSPSSPTPRLRREPLLRCGYHPARRGSVATVRPRSATRRRTRHVKRERAGFRTAPFLERGLHSLSGPRRTPPESSSVPGQ